MNKLVLAAAISTLSVSSAFADDIHYFSTTMASGTVLDPLASFVNTAGTTVKIWYVDPASGAASNKTTPAIQLARSSDWVFDFTNPAAVSFTGSISLGDYVTQTALSGAISVDGRHSFTGVVQTFAGTGVYDEVTNTFAYSVITPINSGGASVYSATAPTTCTNGQTSAFGKVCSSFATVTSAWEGLALNFVFAEDKSSFTGSIQGTNTNGPGLTSLTSKINWYVADLSRPLAVEAVPLPASAWLFGAALVGLAGAGRQRRERRWR